MEEDKIEKEDPKIGNPTVDINPKKYKIGFRINSDIYKCYCGKTIQEYYDIELVKHEKTDDKGKAVYKKDKFGNKKLVKTKFKEWIYHGYPEIYCHCNCGKKWGEHCDGIELKD